MENLDNQEEEIERGVAAEEDLQETPALDNEGSNNENPQEKEEACKNSSNQNPDPPSESETNLVNENLCENSVTKESGDKIDGEWIHMDNIENENEDYEELLFSCRHPSSAPIDIQPSPSPCIYHHPLNCKMDNFEMPSTSQYGGNGTNINDTQAPSTSLPSGNGLNDILLRRGYTQNELNQIDEAAEIVFEVEGYDVALDDNAFLDEDFEGMFELNISGLEDNEDQASTSSNRTPSSHPSPTSTTNSSSGSFASSLSGGNHSRAYALSNLNSVAGASGGHFSGATLSNDQALEMREEEEMEEAANNEPQNVLNAPIHNNLNQNRFNISPESEENNNCNHINNNCDCFNLNCCSNSLMHVPMHAHMPMPSSSNASAIQHNNFCEFNQFGQMSVAEHRSKRQFFTAYNNRNEPFVYDDMANSSNNNNITYPICFNDDDTNDEHVICYFDNTITEEEDEEADGINGMLVQIIDGYPVIEYRDPNMVQEQPAQQAQVVEEGNNNNENVENIQIGLGNLVLEPNLEDEDDDE